MYFLMPLTWLFLIMLFALLIKNPKIKKRLFWSAFLIIIVFGNSFLIDECTRLWEIPAIEIKINDRFEFGIVLSGMTVWDANFNRINFNGNVDRLLQVLPAHKNGQIKNLLISGGDGTMLQDQEKEAILLKKYLASIDFPLNNLHIESESKNTFENALFSSRYLSDSCKIDIKKNEIILITSSMHMRRSFAIFKKQGFNCKAFVTNRISGPRKFSFDHLFIPKAESFNAWHDLLHETVGYLSYLLMGYL